MQKYQLFELIGAGKTGRVYAAQQTETAQVVAIKALTTRLDRASTRLDHPNIVKTLEVLDTDEGQVVVMEYLGGGSLQSLLEHEWRLPVGRVLQIGLDIATALTYAHAQGVIHQNLTPTNILLAADGTARVGDFGFAPQDDRCPDPDPLDERADIWALGMLLYRMLVGEDPIAHALLEIETQRPDTPVALVDLIYRMLAEDRMARLPKMALVQAELAAIYHRTAPPIPSTGLPTPATPLIGRQTEVDAVLDLLDNARLVTLVAPPGMGKTRLAVEIAHRLGKLEIVWVELSPLDELMPTLAERLGLNRGPQQRDWQPTVLEYIREKALVLILDNFSQEPHGVQALLDAAPQVKCLITAHKALGLSRETVYRLNPFSMLPEAHQNPAVQLFLYHARLDVTSAELPLVLQRCQSGVPLEIVLAAGWGEVGEVPFQGMSVLEQTWARLNRAEQTALRQLAVFRGGFTREAVQTISGVSLRQLNNLVGKALLMRDVVTGRYTFHESVREFAFSQLDDPTTLRNHHALYFLEFLSEHELDLRRREPAPCRAVEQEIENIRAAWQWAVEQADYAVLGSAARAMLYLLAFRASPDATMKLFEAAFRHVESLDHLEAALVGICYARSLEYTGQTARAENLAQECLAVFLQLHDRFQEAYARYRLGLIQWEMGQSETARETLLASLQVCREVGDEITAAEVLQWLGRMALDANAIDQALAYYEESVHLARRHRLYLVIADGLGRLGTLALQRDDLSSAQAIYEEVLSVHRRLGHRKGEATTLVLLGNLVEPQQGAEFLQQAAELGDTAQRLDLLPMLALLAEEDGKYLTARAQWEEAVHLIGDDDSHLAAFLHGELSRVLAILLEADFELALKHTETALSIYNARKITQHKETALLARGAVATFQRRLDAARADLLQGLMLCRGQQAVLALYLWARLLIREGEQVQAVAMLTHLETVDRVVWVGEKIQKQLAALKAAMPPELFGDAQAYGQRLETEKLIADILRGN